MPHKPRLVLYQPDYPHNFGGVLRSSACLGGELHLIGPCGFPLDDRRIRQGALDYGEYQPYILHASWDAFLKQRREGRLVLLTTQGSAPLHTSRLKPDDWLLFGQESAGAPDFIHRMADLRVSISMQPGMRSLNLSVSAGIVLYEALRQRDCYSG